MSEKSGGHAEAASEHGKRRTSQRSDKQVQPATPAVAPFPLTRLLSPAQLLAMQRTGGNQAVQRVLTSPTERHVVQRAPSDYKSADDIKKMTLSEFDRYAHAQADWAVSPNLASDKETLRSLLALARKDDSLVLGGCGDYAVGDVLTKFLPKVLAAYSRAASLGKNAGTVHIEQPAADAAEAADWGAAILDLEAGVGGLIIERVVVQNARYPELKRLVDKKAVGDFIKYYKDVNPLLDATNGAEIRSYVEFHKEGGQGKYAGYKTNLPEIRNYHRFTVEQLDALIANKAKAPANPTQKPPLPVSVILQTAFDHNGAFHRDPYMTAVIKRTTHITLVAEGKPSLGDFATSLKAFAQFGKGQKVDEVMVSGHGNAQFMELGGDRGVGQNNAGTTIYGTAANERVTVSPHSSQAARQRTDTFINALAAALRDDPGSRVVLNACLTASNTVNVNLDPDPAKAAIQVKNAIASDPSLATAMKAKLGAHQAEVRGANASFAQVSLLDNLGKIDIISGTDKKLTAPKLEYAEKGTEPTGVLRATLEAWADSKKNTIDALNRRLVKTANDHGWPETVIRALLKVVVANPDNAELIKDLATAASALGHLTKRSECSTATLKGQVPSAHIPAIFAELKTASIWGNAAYEYVPTVVYQVWILKDSTKVADLLTFLNGSKLHTMSAAPYIDLKLLKPFISSALPVPKDPPDRGPFLIALLYMITDRAGAPAKAKAHIKAVVGANKQEFPATSKVDDILKGASQQTVLEDAGVVKKPQAQQQANVGGQQAPVGPPSNIAPTGTGANTVAVESVTMKAKTFARPWTATAYMLPSGTKVGSLPRETSVNVIGKTEGNVGKSRNVPLYAVEYTIGKYKTVFVRQNYLKE